MKRLYSFLVLSLIMMLNTDIARATQAITDADILEQQTFEDKERV